MALPSASCTESAVPYFVWASCPSRRGCDPAVDCAVHPTTVVYEARLRERAARVGVASSVLLLAATLAAWSDGGIASITSPSFKYSVQVRLARWRTRHLQLSTSQRAQEVTDMSECDAVWPGNCNGMLGHWNTIVLDASPFFAFEPTSGFLRCW